MDDFEQKVDDAVHAAYAAFGLSVERVAATGDDTHELLANWLHAHMMTLVEED